MDTNLIYELDIKFKLSQLSDREALEAQLASFISGQAEGSFTKNGCIEDPENFAMPFCFHSHMVLIVADMTAANASRSALMIALEAMPEVVYFLSDIKEKLTSQFG